MVKIQIEVFADTLCPWCYIGKKHLDYAIDLFRQQHPNAVFDVVWRPFYLYPNLEKTGQPKSKLLEPIDIETQSRIVQAGARVGINFRLNAGMTGSSSASHSLLRLAARYNSAGTPSPGATPVTAYSSPSSSVPSLPGSTPSPAFAPQTLSPYPSPQSRLLDALFAAHFEKGLDISSPVLLLELSREVGLSIPEANRALNEIRDTDADASRSGNVVQGVPTLTVQNRWRVGGMQEADVLMSVFERALHEAAGTEQQQRRGESLETVEGAHGASAPPRRGMWLRDILIDDAS